LGTTTLRLVDERGNESTREVFVPLDLGDEGILNVKTVVKPPAPWIVIYRLGESFTYPNASSVNMSIMEYFKVNAKRSPQLAESGKKTRLWNEMHSLGTSEDEREKHKRPIRAVIFDFASVCVWSICPSRISLPDAPHPFPLHAAPLSIAQVCKSSETQSTYVLPA
jgi:sodium-independent sulfate anion transporter 11